MKYTEEEIIKAFKQNNYKVIRELQNYFLPRIHKHIQRNSGKRFSDTRAEAKDLFSKCLIIFWKKITNDSYKLQGKFAEYFTKVYQQQWLKHLKYNSKRTHAPLPINSENIVSEDSTEYMHLLNVDKLKLVWEKIDTLSEKCRKLFTEHYKEGRDYREIGKSRGWKTNNVKGHFRRCKEKLRASFTKMELENLTC